MSEVEGAGLPLFRPQAVEHNASWGQYGEPLAVAPRRFVPALLRRLGSAAAGIARGAARVANRPQRQVRFIAQVESADCGAACLGMVLDHHGVDADLARVREMIGANRDGVTARAIVNAARSLGLRARGVRATLPGLADIPTPAILHWNLNHFVVLEAVHRGGEATIVDPALGRRQVTRADVDRSFSGVVIVFEGSDDARGLRTRPRTPWALLAGLTRPRSRWAFVLCLSLLLQTALLAVPLVTRFVVDRALPQANESSLRLLAWGGGVLFVVLVALSALRAAALVALQGQLDYSLVTRLTAHLLELPYSFFQARSSGDLLMRLRSSTVVREVFTAATVSGLLDGTMVVVSLTAIVLVDWPMAVLVGVLAAAQALVLVCAWGPYRSVAAEQLEAQARSQGVLMELLAGIETLKITGAGRRSAEHWSNLFAREVNIQVRRGNLDAVSEAVVTAVRTLAPVAVLAYGGYRTLDGSMTVGTLLAVVALGTAFLTPVSSLVTTVLRLSVLHGYLQRMQDILATPRERDLGHTSPLARFDGGVVVERVSHRYGTASPLVLDDVSLEVRPGAAVGIVGGSGCGKSTLAMIIAGLYVPSAGRVLFDGQDLAITDLDSVRAQIAAVTQQSYIFAGTLRSNITLGDDDISLDRVMQAARMAQIHDEIAAMPMQYETIVSDGGTTISGGQRQRIALARTFLKNPRLLVLDEATSALDSLTEARILDAVRSRGITRIVVAHRLSTVVDSDVILVLDGGRVVEAGTHEELLAIGGSYAALAQAQR